MGFQRNVGGVDRTLRAIGAAVSFVAAVIAFSEGASLLALVAGLFGVGLAFNAATQFCGVNALLGVDTCSTE